MESVQSQMSNDDDDERAAIEEHRLALGSLIDQLRSDGVDVDALFEEAGLESVDVDSLDYDELEILSTSIAQNHPELTQEVFSRFPLAQGLLGQFLG